MIIPEVYTIIWIAVILLIIYTICVWFGTVFQSVLFQRYRLHKNEAALRKQRLHDQDEEVARYKDGLLGTIKKDSEEKGS